MCKEVCDIIFLFICATNVTYHPVLTIIFYYTFSERHIVSGLSMACFAANITMHLTQGVDHTP